ncbi:MAG: hypothetical protein SNJ70_04995 [Armatimonadota bacterium]
MKHKYALIFFAFVLLSSSAIIERNAVNNIHINKISSDESSLIVLAGQFRSLFANLLWIKADNYHHEYLEENNDWTKNEEILGLMKMIVKLDPSFVEAYAVGAYIYFEGYENFDKGIAMLLEGIKHNPKDDELNRLAAIIYARHYKNYNTALKYAKVSAQYAKDDFIKKRNLRLVRTLEETIREQ